MVRKKLCHKCQHPWDRAGLLPLDAKCLKCGDFLHTCLNCALHDPLAANGCRHEKGEPGPDPASKNFCEVFSFREGNVFSFSPNKLDRKSAEEKWNDLFGSA
jgi:hypothetical protein